MVPGAPVSRALLAAGYGGSGYDRGLSAGLYSANRERAIAERRFLEVRQLANKLFDIDAAVRRSPGTTKARRLIVDTSPEYLRRLAADARGDPGLGLDVGSAYMRVARVQAVP